MLRRPSSLEHTAWSALTLGAAAVLAVAVAFPMSPEAPVELGAACGVVALLMAAGTYLAGDRLPRWAILAQVVLAVALNSALVAGAATVGGAIGDAFAYLWLVAFAALAFPRAGIPVAALAGAGFGVGLLLNDLPGLATPWAIVSLSLLVVAAPLASVSRIAHQRMSTDALTGALNRHGLGTAVARAFTQAGRRDEELAVATLDLDAFKELNDREGHAAGDRLLAEAVDAWLRTLRSQDILARTGGDEFVLVMPGTTPAEAAAVLERLRAAHPVRWSAGVTVRRPDESLDEVLVRADRALYAEKRQTARFAA